MSTFDFDGLMEFAPCSNPSLDFTADECMYHVLVQQSSQRPEPAVSKNVLSVELDLADLVIRWIERVQVVMMPNCSNRGLNWFRQSHVQFIHHAKRI